MTDVATGTSGILRVTAVVSAQSAADLWWDVTWALYLIENKQNSTYNNKGVPASVSVQGVGVVWSGSFTFDWRPAGLQTTLIASGTTRVNAPPSGSGAGLGNVTGSIGATNTSGAGGPTSVTQVLTLPTLNLPPDKPTSVTATRSSDTLINLSWVRNPGSNKPYTGQSVWVSVDGAAPVLAANVAAAATSYAYTASANHRYEFTVRASNGAGTTASDPSNVIVTTPAPLASLTAALVSPGTIRLTLSARPTPHTSAQVVITETHDGGVTWNAKATIPVASLPTSGTYTWDDTSAETGGSIQYRAVVETTAGTQGTLSSTPKLTNVLVLNTPPEAPTGLSPAGNVDATQPIMFEWTHNPSSDGASQSSRRIEISTDGGTTQTLIVAGDSTLPSYEWEPDLNAFTAGQTILYRVATAGSQPGTYGAWSDWQPITLYGSLAVTLLEDMPPEVHGGGPLPVAWSASPTWGDADQTQYRVTMVDDLNGQIVYDSGLVASTDEGTLIPSNVHRDGHAYTVTVFLVDNHNIVSVGASRVVTMDYLEPGPVQVTFEYDDEGTGQLVFSPEFSPESSSPFDDTVAWSLERSVDEGQTWVLVAMTNGDYPATDPLPMLNRASLYRTVGYTELGVAGPPTVVEVPAEVVRSRWGWLNFEDDPTRFIRFGWGQTIDVTAGRDSTSVAIEGVPYPRPLWGEGITEQFSVSTTLMWGGNLPAALATSTDVDVREFFKDAQQRCIFRDGSGTWIKARVHSLKVAQPPAVDPSQPHVAAATFTVERVAL